MDMDSPDEQTFKDTVLENRNFGLNFNRYESSTDFLKRKEKVCLRGISLDKIEQEEWLEIKPDIDGSVLELDGFHAISMPIRHLKLLPDESGNLRPVKDILKKHVNLTLYSKSELRNFDNSVGFQLFYERGWECWMAMIPRYAKGIVEFPSEVIRTLSLESFTNLRNAFQLELGKYVRDGIALRTLMKNNINNVRKMFILPDDSGKILLALQRAYTKIEMKNFKPILFCFRFGEKQTDGVSLRDFNVQGMACVTIHAAVDISCQCENVFLMWSLDGLNEVIGRRGTLGTCLSFTDCANFQSNLDGRPLDIDESLKRVCKYPANIRFIQLYGDTPHQRPKCRFHPISGSIIAGMCVPSKTSAAFLCDAERYLSSVESNFLCFQGTSCRLEIVVQCCEMKEHFQATDFIDLTHLTTVLEEKAMLVPVTHDDVTAIRRIGLSAKQQLQEVYLKYRKTGNITATWQAYQLELAIEKLLWGRPLCWRSNSFAINLGPGVLGHSRSLSDVLGFLAMDDASACMKEEDSIPPIQIWTLSPEIAKCIKRAAGVHDHLPASYGVIGRHLITALLKDLHDLGKATLYSSYAQFLQEIQSRTTKYKVVGAITKTSLCDSLIYRRRTDTRMVYPKLSSLLEANNLNLLEVVMAGFEELNLQHFPAIKLYDSHRNAVLAWSYKDNYWKILNDGKVVENDRNAHEVMSDLVKADLEKRGLVYVSKIKKTPRILPWTDICLKRLKVEKLSLELTVTTLSFLSCIALLMQGWYVEFENLPRLIRDVPISANRLKALEILSNFQLSMFNFHGIQLFRLHFSIPHKLPACVEVQPSQAISEDVMPVELNENALVENVQKIGDVDPTCDEDIATRRNVTCRPIRLNVKARWTLEELEFLHAIHRENKDSKLTDMFDVFKKKCMDANIPFRTFDSFRRKFNRIQY